LPSKECLANGHRLGIECLRPSGVVARSADSMSPRADKGKHMICRTHFSTPKLTILVLVSCLAACSRGAAEQRVPLCGVHEVVFDGPRCGAGEAPARDVELVTQWRHESGSPTCAILGFWDGDGHGGTAGTVFKAWQAGGAS